MEALKARSVPLEGRVPYFKKKNRLRLQALFFFNIYIYVMIKSRKFLRPCIKSKI